MIINSTTKERLVLTIKAKQFQQTGESKTSTGVLTLIHKFTDLINKDQDQFLLAIPWDARLTLWLILMIMMEQSQTGAIRMSIGKQIMLDQLVKRTLPI